MSRIGSNLHPMARQRSGTAEFFSGLGATVLFGSLYLFLNSGIFIFVGVLAGVLPMIRGVSKMIDSRVARNELKQVEGRTQENTERIVLSLARSQRGQLTPTIVAVNSGLTLEQAETQLRELVDKGYASLDVSEDGRLIYTFPEFLRREALPPGDEPT
jgi:hypothetical protein